MRVETIDMVGACYQRAGLGERFEAMMAEAKLLAPALAKVIFLDTMGHNANGGEMNAGQSVDSGEDEAIGDMSVD